MNFETIINITCTIISLIAICQWVITGINKLVKYFRDLKHLKQALQISSKSCCISLSVFEKRITGNVHDYITLYAVKSYQLLETILEKNEISIQPMSTSYEGNNDKIYIGGPAANVEVNSLLTRFKEFKYYTESHQESTYDKNEINQHFIVYDDNKKGFMFKDRFFKIDKKTNDVGIFIRIPKNEKKGINYTSHIIFAAWDVGTYNAVEFFVNNYKIISKKFKNRPYCFVVPISRIDNSTRLLTENDIEDVSKEFFKGTDILNY